MPGRTHSCATTNPWKEGLQPKMASCIVEALHCSATGSGAALTVLVLGVARTPCMLPACKNAPQSALAYTASDFSLADARRSASYTMQMAQISSCVWTSPGSLFQLSEGPSAQPVAVLCAAASERFCCGALSLCAGLLCVGCYRSQPGVRSFRVWGTCRPGALSSRRRWVVPLSRRKWLLGQACLCGPHCHMRTVQHSNLHRQRSSLLHATWHVAWRRALSHMTAGRQLSSHILMHPAASTVAGSISCCCHACKGVSSMTSLDCHGISGHHW